MIITRSGPLPDELDVLPDVAAGVARGLELIRARAARNIHRGPGRYGHLADQLTVQVRTKGQRVTGVMGPRGKAAYKLVFLERGARGHLITARASRRAERIGVPAPLAFHPQGGPLIFRQFAHHPGIVNPPKPLGRAIAEGGSEAVAAVTDAMQRAVQGHGR
jgi:hypothetical protein